MAGRFPGAADLDEFWTNIRSGRQNIEVSPWVQPESSRPGSSGTGVRAGGVLADPELFDAGFFGYSPREAELLDPQQRVFLECVWTAIEDAGQSGRDDAAIGVYAGSSLSTYLLYHLLPNTRFADVRDDLILGNNPDMLATRVAYHLDLHGPAMSVQTACSTSLVAVHLACQALLADDCDVAVAGGVSIRLPQQSPHRSGGDGILSPDGGCLPFDSRAAGTVSGNGVGAVVLKPLAAALADHDPVRAVIKATAINNDGHGKVGFVAPSARGQAAAIRTAHTVADVDPATIGYVEAHGTATALGDPIEFAALAEAFGGDAPDRHGRCTLGSIKALIGHLDAAAGIAGLIKTVLALENGVLPPSPHFEASNPAIDLTGSRFQLVRAAQDWPRAGTPRRAGVSSFGMGGTNAHVVVEEAPSPRAVPASSRGHQLVVLSAPTQTALQSARTRLRAHLTNHEADQADLADVAHTLQRGRTVFPHRLAVVCESREDAVERLADGSATAMTGHHGSGRRETVFMFSGQGTQHPGMGADVHRAEPAYREAFDECAELLVPHLGLDIRDLVLPANGPGAAATLRRTEYAQPALFAVEYALARQWQEWGVIPTAMIGHSIGEYVAACLAGTMRLADALRLVTVRGRLMQSLPPGRMASVGLPAAEAERYVRGDVVVAAANGPALTVLSGPVEEMDAVERALTADGVTTRLLHTSHAFHSPAMDPILSEYRALVGQVSLSPPGIPFVSNLTGTWIGEEAGSPDYWVRHLRHRVRFHDGLTALTEAGPLAMLEVGPGTALATLARQSLPAGGHVILTSLPQPGQDVPGTHQMAEALGRLWLAGAEPDWAGYWRHEQRRRVRLPAYPFERRRYWIDPP
ncbi:MAG: type I polyketide synthase, partial [Actinoallomurus sp.]